MKFKNMKTLYISIISSILVSGCLTPVTIEYSNGVKEKRWESGKTTRARMKLDFLDKTLSMKNDNGTQDYKQGNCDHIVQPQLNDIDLWRQYYNAAENCSLVNNSGSGIQAEEIAAINGTPTTDFGWAITELEKTERSAEKEKTKRLNIFAAIGTEILRTGKDIYIADNFGEGSTGNGGVYVRGDVITSQTGSNSGQQGGSGEASGGEMGNPSGSGTSGEQNRALGQSVFGNNVNSLASEASRLTSTGDGATALLEPSANGFVTEDSELKGVVNSDQFNQNAPYNFDDGEDGINVTGDL